jgi:hypothetical protein
MRLAEDNDMVEAITSDRADEPLRISILLWRAWRDRPIPNAHRPHALNEPGAVNAVQITDYVSRRISPAKRLSELPGLRQRSPNSAARTLCALPRSGKPVSVTYRTGLGRAETEIGKWRAETGAMKPPGLEPKVRNPIPMNRRCKVVSGQWRRRSLTATRLRAAPRRALRRAIPGKVHSQRAAVYVRPRAVLGARRVSAADGVDTTFGARQDQCASLAAQRRGPAAAHKRPGCSCQARLGSRSCRPHHRGPDQPCLWACPSRQRPGPP